MAVQTTTIVIHNHNSEHYIIIVLGYWILILKLFHSKFKFNTTFQSRILKNIVFKINLLRNNFIIIFQYHEDGKSVSLGNQNFNQILHSLLSQFEEANRVWYLGIASIVPPRYLLTITY